MSLQNNILELQILTEKNARDGMTISDARFDFKGVPALLSFTEGHWVASNEFGSSTIVVLRDYLIHIEGLHPMMPPMSYSDKMHKKLWTITTGEAITGYIREEVRGSHLFWAIIRHNLDNYELILTRPSYTQFNEFTPTFTNEEMYTTTELTEAISAAGISESVLAAKDN